VVTLVTGGDPLMQVFIFMLFLFLQLQVRVMWVTRVTRAGGGTQHTPHHHLWIVELGSGVMGDGRAIQEEGFPIPPIHCLMELNLW